MNRTTKNGKSIIKGKKFSYKKAILLGLFATVMLGACSPKKDSETAKSSEKTAETAKKESAKIGDVVTVGKVEYTINSKEIVDTVGSEYLNKKANGKFIVLDVTIKNNEDKEITISDNFFVLLKGKTEFKSDSSATMYVNEAANFLYSSLNPENSITGKVVFDVSEETANNEELKLQVQTGFWGTEKGIIDLK